VPRPSEEILTDEPPPAADERIAYGPQPLQFATCAARTMSVGSTELSKERREQRR
jgi:hypothetical protein